MDEKILIGMTQLLTAPDDQSTIFLEHMSATFLTNFSRKYERSICWYYKLEVFIDIRYTYNEEKRVILETWKNKKRKKKAHIPQLLQKS